MDSEVTVTMTVRGLVDPGRAEDGMIRMLKRSLYLVDGKKGDFTARIDAPGGSIELDPGTREWRDAPR